LLIGRRGVALVSYACGFEAVLATKGLNHTIDVMHRCSDAEHDRHDAAETDPEAARECWKGGFDAASRFVPGKPVAIDCPSRSQRR